MSEWGYQRVVNTNKLNAEQALKQAERKGEHERAERLRWAIAAVIGFGEDPADYTESEILIRSRC